MWGMEEAGTIVRRCHARLLEPGGGRCMEETEAGVQGACMEEARAGCVEHAGGARLLVGQGCNREQEARSHERETQSREGVAGGGNELGLWNMKRRGGLLAGLGRHRATTGPIGACVVW